MMAGDRAGYWAYARRHGWTGSLSRGSRRLNLRKSNSAVDKILADYRSGAITAGEAYRRISSLYDSGKIYRESAVSAVRDLKKEDPGGLPVPGDSLEEISTAVQLGAVRHSEGLETMLETLAGDSDWSNLTRNLIPERLSVAQRTRLGKFSGKSFSVIKFTAKNTGSAALTGSRMLFRSGRSFFNRSFTSQLGGSSGDAVTDELSGSARRTFSRYVTPAVTGAVKAPVRSVSVQIRHQYRMRKSLITEKKASKINSSFDLNGHITGKQRSFARKLNRSDVTAAKRSPGALRTAADITAGSLKDLSGRAAASGRKTLASFPASMTKFSGRQVSKAAGEAFGSTDPTLSAMGGFADRLIVEKALHPVRTAKKTARTGRTLRRAGTNVARGVRAAGEAVLRAFRGFGRAVATNPAVIAVILGLALVIVLVAAAAGSCVPIALMGGGIAGSFEGYQSGLDGDAARQLALDADEIYYNAECSYHDYAFGMTVEEAARILNAAGLDDENAYVDPDCDAVYHNPYCLIAYLCTVYGDNWTLGDAEAEADYTSGTSIISRQYTLSVSLGGKDDDGRQQIVVRFENNGFNAAVNSLLENRAGALSQYRMLCYYYGNPGGDEPKYYWDTDSYATHEEGVSAADYISGNTNSDFNIDNSMTARVEFSTSYQDAATGYAWPLENYYGISSGYGWRTLYGKADFHPAIDIGVGAIAYSTDIPVLACIAGTVIDCPTSMNSARGWLVEVEDANGYKLIYQHLKYYPGWRYGDTVAQGQVLGYVGSTGNSTGPHLHLEVIVNNGKSWPDNTIDPLLLFPNI